MNNKQRTTNHERRATINMQNKPNLLDSQMNVSSVLAKDYENKRLSGGGENKPKTNPTCRGVASGEAGSPALFLPSPSIANYYGIQDILYPSHRVRFSAQNPPIRQNNFEF